MDPTVVMSKIAKALFADPLFTVTLFTATGDGTGWPRIKAAMGPAGVAKLTIYHNPDAIKGKDYVFLVEVGNIEARLEVRDSDALFPLGVIRIAVNEIGCNAAAVLSRSTDMLKSIDASIDAIRTSTTTTDPQR